MQRAGGLCQTPDRCPPPPSAPIAPETTKAAATDTSVELQAIGPQKYGAIKSALNHAFPQANVTNKTVDKIVRLLLFRGTGPNQDGSHREVAPISRRVEEKQHRLTLEMRSTTASSRSRPTGSRCSRSS